MLDVKILRIDSGYAVGPLRSVIPRGDLPQGRASYRNTAATGNTAKTAWRNLPTVGSTSLGRDLIHANDPRRVWFISPRNVDSINVLLNSFLRVHIRIHLSIRVVRLRFPRVQVHSHIFVVHFGITDSYLSTGFFFFSSLYLLYAKRYCFQNLCAYLLRCKCLSRVQDRSSDATRDPSITCSLACGKIACAFSTLSEDAYHSRKWFRPLVVKKL